MPMRTRRQRLQEKLTEAEYEAFTVPPPIQDWPSILAGEARSAIWRHDSIGIYRYLCVCRHAQSLGWNIRYYPVGYPTTEAAIQEEVERAERRKRPLVRVSPDESEGHSFADGTQED